MQFELKSKFKPNGDQPKAIKELLENIKKNKTKQVLLGATGTGKTFTIANVIQEHKRPTLILAHNKTLASQLFGELKSLFPNNRVEYFVSYFDYYQPEAYLPGNDIYIEKDSKVNEEIERMRHSATASLFEGEDVIVVSSVSCIYGLGSPKDYNNLLLSIREGQEIEQKAVTRKLIDLQYNSNTLDLKTAGFRVNGDVIEFVPPYLDNKYVKIEFFGDEIESISEVDILTNKKIKKIKHFEIYPASHYVFDPQKTKEITSIIKQDLDKEVNQFIKEDKLVEAQRLKQRTEYDIEMLNETGMCNGIENYTRYFSDLEEGDPPYTLIDYFPKNFLLIIDESHVTIPQVRGMYNGDRARKENLVKYGFRVKAALDNRPLRFEEFESKTNKTIYVSATPSDYERQKSHNLIVEQIIRPTGLIDPPIEVKPKDNQMDEILNIIKDKETNKVLITTLTKKMAEDLTEYLKDLNIKVAYLHSDIKTLERVKIINQLRAGTFDVLIGINLLREGLDIPEVNRVLILDADKQGFLRSETSLIQTIGRAARNSTGKVIMFANEISNAMQVAIEETKRRRDIQIAYNTKYNIEPTSIQKDIHEIDLLSESAIDTLTNNKSKKEEKQRIISDLKSEMNKASKNLDFEEAMRIRDIIFEIEGDNV